MLNSISQYINKSIKRYKILIIPILAISGVVYFYQIESFKKVVDNSLDTCFKSKSTFNQKCKVLKQSLAEISSKEVNSDSLKNYLILLEELITLSKDKCIIYSESQNEFKMIKEGYFILTASFLQTWENKRYELEYKKKLNEWNILKQSLVIICAYGICSLDEIDRIFNANNKIKGI
jgi:hypothetical protein